MAWLSPSCHALHCRLRIFHLWNGRRFPPQPPGGARCLAYPTVIDPEAPPIRPERHVENSIATIRNASPSRSQNPSRDVHAVSRRPDDLQPDCVYDTVKLRARADCRAPSRLMATKRPIGRRGKSSANIGAANGLNTIVEIFEQSDRAGSPVDQTSFGSNARIEALSARLDHHRRH